jgi:hypothetical protein
MDSCWWQDAVMASSGYLTCVVVIVLTRGQPTRVKHLRFSWPQTSHPATLWDLMGRQVPSPSCSSFTSLSIGWSWRYSHACYVCTLNAVRSDTSVELYCVFFQLCQRSLNQSGRAMWEASLQNCPPLYNLGVPYGQLFAFDLPGYHVLTCGLNGGSIYQVLLRSCYMRFEVSTVVDIRSASTK